jgi:hypothetical protein
LSCHLASNLTCTIEIKQLPNHAAAAAVATALYCAEAEPLPFRRCCRIAGTVVAANDNLDEMAKQYIGEFALPLKQ